MKNNTRELKQVVHNSFHMVHGFSRVQARLVFTEIILHAYYAHAKLTTRLTHFASDSPILGASGSAHGSCVPNARS